MPTGITGVYEFAPGERAGPISNGDALLTLRAAVARIPDLPVAAALGTALSLLNIADRGPDIPEVAFAKGPKVTKVPSAIRRTYRVLRFNWKLPVDMLQGAPVHRAATVLVHAADRPTDVRSWGGMLELLPAIIAAAPLDEIATEIGGRPHATKIRLAYLTESIAPGLGEALKIKPAGKVWFGPRRQLRRHDARWNVADTILPFAPYEILT
ncbi:MAG: type IV toxin-antitoxin system AbiEi family antitoxin [Gemmatimonadota bacterium]|nr:type IV toxin-antitoxin system AbiEi family antitoxin [Gemmatimonadota bacterium]